MAWIENLKISPAEHSVNPALNFRIGLKIDKSNELPVSYSGALLDREEKRLATLSHWEIRDRTKKSIRLSNSDYRSNIVLNLHFELTQNALEHIEWIRDQNDDNDIELKLELNVGSIFSKINDPKIYAQNDNNHLAQKKSELFKYQGRDNPGTAQELKILSANTSSEILEVQYRELSRNLTISSSDWTQKYCPILGIGKFATVDLYIPESKEAETEIEKYLDDAIQTVQKMEQYIQAGEWSNVIEESRKLAEVLREKDNKSVDQWKELLSKSGYQDDALDRFYSMLQNLFQFSSKFVHRIDFDNNLRDQVKVEKEDAYFIYTTSVGLVNLLSRKVQEFKKTQ